MVDGKTNAPDNPPFTPEHWRKQDDGIAVNPLGHVCGIVILLHDSKTLAPKEVRLDGSDDMVML